MVSPTLLGHPPTVGTSLIRSERPYIYHHGLSLPLCLTGDRVGLKTGAGWSRTCPSVSWQACSLVTWRGCWTLRRDRVRLHRRAPGGGPLRHRHGDGLR